MNDYGKLIEPPPVPFSFGAPGWYVLAGLLLLVLLTFAWLAWKHYQKNKYRQTALQWLNVMEADCSANRDYQRLVYEATMLMKRIAMRQYGRTAVAAKRRDEFINYINSTWRAAAFDEEDQALFSSMIYSNTNVEATKTQQYTSKVKAWIRQHRYRQSAG